MRPQPRVSARLGLATAALIAAAAIGLIVSYPQARIELPSHAAIVATDGNASRLVGTAQLSDMPAAATSATLTISTDRSKLATKSLVRP